MKFLLLLSLAMFSTGAFSNDMDKMKEWDKKIDSQSLEESKKMMLEKTDKMDKKSEEMKKCINDAADKEALKKCHADMAKHHKK
jgi:Fe2+ transport system protein B